MRSRDVYANGFDESNGKTTSGADCPDCDTTLRTVDGEVSCPDCGLVVDACRLDRSGPRTFEDDEDQKGHHGGPITETRHDRGLSTKIGRRTDAQGNSVPNEKRRRLARMRREHKRGQFQSKRDRNLAKGCTEIARLTGALDLSTSIREQASSLFRTAQSENLLMGRSIEAIATACVYVACRIAGITRTFEAVASPARVDASRVDNAYRVLNRELDLPIPPRRAAEFVPMLASTLDLPRSTAQRAESIAAGVQGEPAVTGRHPAGLAAACLYLAANDQAVDLTQQEVADAAEVSPMTVRNSRDAVRSALDEDH